MEELGEEKVIRKDKKRMEDSTSEYFPKGIEIKILKKDGQPSIFFVA